LAGGVGGKIVRSIAGEASCGVAGATKSSDVAANQRADIGCRQREVGVAGTADDLGVADRTTAAVADGSAVELAARTASQVVGSITR